jgi:uncharacterized protein YeaO (DUF488 family)
MEIRLKRAYEEPQEADGFRILVDRLWPRGVSRDSAAIDLWLKEIAPSNELRKWFAHDPGKWEEFRNRYVQELDHNSASVEELSKRLREGKVTLVYAAKDQEHNNAVVIREYLEKKRI